MRLFIAASLPPGIKLAVEAKIAALRSRVERGSWTRADSLHVTLAFLGEQPENSVTPLDVSLRRELAGSASFEAQLQGAGFFPNARRPRVGWLGLQPAAQFEELAERVRAALRVTSIGFDQKPFKSHLTVARFREGLPQEQAADFVATLGVFCSDPFAVVAVHLYSSVLTPRGAVHTPLQSYALR